MGTLLLGQIKKQASSFLQEKYRSARLVLTDVTQAELLAEEATNGDPCSPDTRIMNKIAEASFGIDDFWRIVDILHRKFYNVDWKQWRQSYKSLIVLEFLLTHGPEDFAREFQCDVDVIQELGSFQYTDERGFDWGLKMQKKSDEVLKLLGEGPTLKQARLKALKITKEIQGFGNPISSPNSALSPPGSSTSTSSRTSSFGSFSTLFNNNHDHMSNDLPIKLVSPKKEPAAERYPEGVIRDNVNEKDHCLWTPLSKNGNVEGKHLWTCPQSEEKGSLLKGEDDDHDHGAYENITNNLVSKNMYTRIDRVRNPGSHGFKSISDVGKRMKKKIDRQFSLWY
ncbi:epsin-3 [Ziziphus jujuba]|uniref:Epsin-3 n=1 Tax=Ziziphus jujuba TaxID=326968 RepID=A0ABM3IRQ0_ZIZJJ|nr:epsin-3 [Ziziphus jujuba]